MASDEGTSVSNEYGSISDRVNSTMKEEYKAQSSGTFVPAVVLLACDCPNEMQSDVPVALHTMAELPIINHSVNAALTLNPSQIIITAGQEQIEAVQQVVQKAHPHEACPFIFLGVDVSAQDGEDITRRQRQKALDALADDITEVIAWPCHWHITQDVAKMLLSRGREKYQTEGAGCYLLHVEVGSGKSVSKEAPHPLWATAGYWRKTLQSDCRSNSGRCYETYDKVIGQPPTIITNRWDLREVEHRLRCAELRRHSQAGVTFRDSEHGTHLSTGLQIGKDTVIGVGVQIYGKTVIGRNVSIEGPTVIKDSVIGDNCRIGAFSHLDQATLASGSGVGPFARMRAGAAIDSGAYIGNFVELKGAHVGQGGNVCHLSYLGDADVGDRANIGAGTITCNYNGVAKNRTSIAADAFIGSNSTLVAPVTVGQGALVAAGSVITSDVPADALALGRSRQSTLEHRANATRGKLRAQEEQKKSRPG